MKKKFVFIFLVNKPIDDMRTQSLIFEKPDQNDFILPVGTYVNPIIDIIGAVKYHHYDMRVDVFETQICREQTPLPPNEVNRIRSLMMQTDWHIVKNVEV